MDPFSQIIFNLSSIYERKRQGSPGCYDVPASEDGVKNGDQIHPNEKGANR